MFKKPQSILLQHPGDDHDMVEILTLVLHHDEGAVLGAVELTLECSKPSKEHTFNLLGCSTEEPPPEPTPIPKELRLILEPQANVNRYDSLRRAHDVA